MKLLVREGAQFAKRLTWYDDSSALINMTGWSGRMHVRADLEDEETVIELSTSNGRMTLGNGTIDLEISSADTIGLESGVFDILLNDGTEEIFLLEGDFIVIQGVTR